MMASLPVANDSQNPGESKNTTTATNQLHPPEQSPKCPRCDSSNTKFCYYNNYSLTQPRHFCKTCRRYWTKGGALRNVPVGGGCRKSKKNKSSAPSSCSSSSSSSSRLPLDHFVPMTSIADPNSGGLKFFNGLGGLPFSTLHNNQFISFGDLTPTTAPSTSMVGFNYPLSSAVGVYSEMGSSSSALNNSTHHSSLASSIESLSSINQDLHWKLQQQRLAMLTHKENSVHALPAPLLDNQQDPISFQVTESFRAEVYGNSEPGKVCAGDPNTTTAWFLDSPYTLASINTNTSSDNIASNWNGIPTWNDMHHFTTLP